METLVVKMTSPKHAEVFRETLREPGPHEMILRMTIAGICRSETPTFLGEGAMLQKGPLGFTCIIEDVPYPLSFGHEPTGVIEATGSAVTRFKEGDRVSGVCGGAFSSRVTVSEFAPFIKLPDTLSDTSTLAEPVMCCCNIIRDIRPPEKMNIAIVGCGYMGLITICLLKAYGVSPIVAFDPLPERRALALKHGADHVFDSQDPNALKEALELTNGLGFDRAVELSRGLGGLLTAASLMKIPTDKDRGIIAASSVYDKKEMWPPQLGFELMCRTPELHIVHPGFFPDVPSLMQEAVDAYAKHYIPEDGLITHRFAPEDICSAYEMMMNNDTSYLKGVVEFK